MTLERSVDLSRGEGAQAAAHVRSLDARTRRDRRESCPFAVCDGSGFVVDEATNTASDCRCRAQRIATARARGLWATIPKHYRHVAFDRPPVIQIEPRRAVDEVRKYCDNLNRNLDRGRGLWLMGPVGTGKTSLAMLVSKAALEAGRSVGIYSLPQLMREIRRDIHREGGASIDLVRRLTSIDLLHIDDVGAERTTEWVIEELYTIINARYEDERSVLITTNIMDHDKLCEQITERTVSRLHEMCDELHLDGHDHRMDPESART